MKITIEIEAGSESEFIEKLRDFIQASAAPATPAVVAKTPAPTVKTQAAPAPASPPAPAPKPAATEAVVVAPGSSDHAMKLIGGKELSKHKLSELSAIASGHGFSLAGMSRPQIELAVGSLVFGDGSTAQQLRADLDEAAAPKQAPKAAKAVAAAAAAPKAVEEPKRGRGRPKKVVEPEPELEDEEPEEEEPEEEPAPAPVKKAAPAKKPAPPEPEPDVGPDHIPEEPDYSDLVDEDGEADEDADEDFEEEEAPAPKGKAFKVDAKNVPDFLKTAPKLTTIVTGLAKLYNVSDPDKIVEMLKAFAPYSPKIQQNLASITTLRIKGILSMSSGK